MHPLLHEKHRVRVSPVWNMTNINVLFQMVVVIKGQKWSGQFLVFACCHHGKVPRGEVQCQQVGWNWSLTLMHHNLSKDHTHISGITCHLPSWSQKLVQLALRGGFQNTHESKGCTNVWQVCFQGHFAKSQNLAFLVFFFWKCKFSDSMTSSPKLGLLKLGSWFSDPSWLGSQF